jgi:hypothetical protein
MLVVVYRRFGTAYRPHLERSCDQENLPKRGQTTAQQTTQKSEDLKTLLTLKCSVFYSHSRSFLILTIHARSTRPNLLHNIMSSPYGSLIISYPRDNAILRKSVQNIHVLSKQFMKAYLQSTTKYPPTQTLKFNLCNKPKISRVSHSTH